MMAAEKVRTFSMGESNSNVAAAVGPTITGTTVHHESSSSSSDCGNELLVQPTIIMDSSSSIMNLSQISAISGGDLRMGEKNQAHPSQTACRFPKLEECAHFHYERVQLGAIMVRVVDERFESQNSVSAMQLNGGDQLSASQLSHANNFHFILRVSARRSEPFLIKRSLDNLKMLDELLHRCVYDRKVSGLQDLQDIDRKWLSTGDRDDITETGADLSDTQHDPPMSEEQLMKCVSQYFTQFSAIASDSMTCGPVLTWLQLDNKGRRLPVADLNTMTTINTPAVGAAYGVRKYVAQACDEISIEVGDMISVIDMPSPAESVWWRGKKSHMQKAHYEVGFFPQSCVATIGEKIPRHMPLPAPLVGSLALSPSMLF